MVVMSSIRLHCLSRECLQALADNDTERAASLLGAAIPAELSAEQPVWRHFGNQLDENPEWIGWTMHAVFDQKNEIVGHAGFHRGPDADGMVEVGCTILTDHRGQGLANATVAALLERAAREPRVTRVRACIAPSNLPSIAVVKRLGFEKVGQVDAESDGVELVFERAAPAMKDHYFSGSPRVADKRRDVDLRIWGKAYTLSTASGVFAREGLDKATDVLLRNSTPPAGGMTLLDLGCGWGPIACALADADPGASVWAADTNERAVDLTRANAERLGVHVNALLPDDVPADLVFDEIWSNPPIRIGKQALHELLLHWLPRLKPGGTARLVVGKNLGADSLQAWLIEQGWPTERQISEKGFRVLVVSTP